MANNVYIGMRYVPKFVGNWDTTMQTVYEPLSIVMYNNSTYTSKKEVPTGTNITDTDYWVLTGNYNGQISNLQNQIDDMKDGTVPGSLQDQINDIVNTDLPAIDAKIDTRELKQSERNYILIFDSYGSLGISTIAAQACPGGCHVLNVGGAGFSGAGGGQTWGDALTAYVSTLSAADKAAVTDVMVFGGVNDYNESTSDITTKMGQFDTYVKNNLTNAHVTLAPISWPIRMDNTPIYYARYVCTSYSKKATELGWTYAFGLSAFIHNDTLMESDGIHPTSAGANALGYAIKNFIITGKIPELTTDFVDATITPATGFTSVVGSRLTSMIANNRIRVNCNLIVQTTTPVTVQSGYTNALNLASITNSYIFGNIFNNVAANIATVPAYIHDTNSGTWVLKPVTIQIYFGLIYLSVEGGSITFDAIQTTQFTLESDLLLG